MQRGVRSARWTGDLTQGELRDEDDDHLADGAAGLSLCRRLREKLR